MRQLTTLCALALAACGDSEAARELLKQEQKISSATDRVRAELRDPASAEFSSIGIHGISTVCGRVNSRNGFGGMSGPQRFVVTKSTVFLQERQDAVIPGHFDGFWRQMCE